VLGGLNIKIKNIIDNIESELDLLKNDDLNNDADDLINNIIETNQIGNIFVYGAGRSGFIGRSFVMRLVQAGITAFLIGEPSMQPMNRRDILIIISGSGKTPSIKNVVETSKKNKLEIIMVSSNSEAKTDQIDKIIEVQGKSKLNNKNSALPLGSSFEINAYIFLECLITKLIEKSPEARANIEKVAEKYRNNELVVF
jgi:6-phospho-3-hexuloisomerase